MFVDYYAVLGVSPLCSADDIRGAFRRLALRCHPDRCEDRSAASFHSAKDAYDVLSDPARRYLYDLGYAAEAARQPKPPNPPHSSQSQSPAQPRGALPPLPVFSSAHSPAPALSPSQSPAPTLSPSQSQSQSPGPGQPRAPSSAAPSQPGAAGSSRWSSARTLRTPYSSSRRTLPPDSAPTRANTTGGAHSTSGPALAAVRTLRQEAKGSLGGKVVVGYMYADGLGAAAPASYKKSTTGQRWKSNEEIARGTQPGTAHDVFTRTWRVFFNLPNDAEKI